MIAGGPSNDGSYVRFEPEPHNKVRFPTERPRRPGKQNIVVLPIDETPPPHQRAASNNENRGRKRPLVTVLRKPKDYRPVTTGEIDPVFEIEPEEIEPAANPHIVLVKKKKQQQQQGESTPPLKNRQRLQQHPVVKTLPNRDGIVKSLPIVPAHSTRIIGNTPHRASSVHPNQRVRNPVKPSRQPAAPVIRPSKVVAAAKVQPERTVEPVFVPELDRKPKTVQLNVDPAEKIFQNVNKEKEDLEKLKIKLLLEAAKVNDNDDDEETTTDEPGVEITTTPVIIDEEELLLEEDEMEITTKKAELPFKTEEERPDFLPIIQKKAEKFKEQLELEELKLKEEQQEQEALLDSDATEKTPAEIEELFTEEPQNDDEDSNLEISIRKITSTSVSPVRIVTSVASSSTSQTTAAAATTEGIPTESTTTSTLREASDDDEEEIIVYLSEETTQGLPLEQLEIELITTEDDIIVDPDDAVAVNDDADVDSADVVDDKDKVITLIKPEENEKVTLINPVIDGVTIVKPVTDQVDLNNRAPVPTKVEPVYVVEGVTVAPKAQPLISDIIEDNFAGEDEQSEDESALQESRVHTTVLKEHEMEEITTEKEPPVIREEEHDGLSMIQSVMDHFDLAAIFEFLGRNGDEKEAEKSQKLQEKPQRVTTKMLDIEAETTVKPATTSVITTTLAPEEEKDDDSEEEEKVKFVKLILKPEEIVKLSFPSSEETTTMKFANDEDAKDVQIVLPVGWAEPPPVLTGATTTEEPETTTMRKTLDIIKVMRATTTTKTTTTTRAPRAHPFSKKYATILRGTTTPLPNEEELEDDDQVH